MLKVPSTKYFFEVRTGDVELNLNLKILSFMSHKHCLLILRTGMTQLNSTHGSCVFCILVWFVAVK